MAHLTLIYVLHIVFCFLTPGLLWLLKKINLSVTENVADFNISMPSADSESYLKDDLMCIKCRDPGSRNEEIEEVQRGLKTHINYALKFGNDALVQYLQN